MKKEIEKFVCVSDLSEVKIEYQKSLGLMQPLSIYNWKWDTISMAFVTRFPKTVKNGDIIWVIVDRLMKYAHFIPMKLDYPLERLENLYIERIVSLHNILSSIVFDRDLRFTSGSWRVYG